MSSGLNRPPFLTLSGSFGSPSSTMTDGFVDPARALRPEVSARGDAVSRKRFCICPGSRPSLLLQPEVLMETDGAETGVSQQRTDAIARVEPLRVVLIGDDAVARMQDDLARDQAVVVGGDVALPERQVLRVDPLPAPRHQMGPQPAAVDQVERQRPLRREAAPDRFEQRAVVVDMLEIAERVAHQVDAVERSLPAQAAARIAFEKVDDQAKRAGRARAAMPSR